jgi:hypothetical protein
MISKNQKGIAKSIIMAKGIMQAFRYSPGLEIKASIFKTTGRMKRTKNNIMDKTIFIINLLDNCFSAPFNYSPKGRLA